MPNVYRNIARDYIEKYQKQVSYLRYLEEKLEKERSRAESLRSTCDIPGEVIGDVFYPYETSSNVSPHSKEDELLALVDASRRYDEQKQVVDSISGFIVKSIYNSCEVSEAEAFLYMNMLNMSAREVGRKLNYSIQRIYQLNRKATEKLGRAITAE